MSAVVPPSRQIPCFECPLRRLPVFSNGSPEEIAFIQSFKIGELNANAGATIYQEGANSPHLFTILDGWAFRYKTLPDGRRQILNYALQGDFIGLQNTLAKSMEHGVEALTSLRLCVFSRARLFELFASQPTLGLDIAWLAAREERFLDSHLLAVGRRTATERIAYLLWHLAVRAREAGFDTSAGVELPMRQQHLADTLGMSLVSFNKTLQRLRTSGCITLVGRTLRIEDERVLLRIAKVDPTRPERRPLI
ncbi:Crp/Fnr family transcriptional regulator [Prosthecomicrobium sp. N25]|uniref:Crp/Fnr family transcriptional regulator n=1 Tax=Prosthecomicrobium sp. N25 TaxID=3129254 RepID=UPI00307708B3